MRKFARVRTRHSTNFGAKCSTDSAHSFADVIVVAQLTQRTPAESSLEEKQLPEKSCRFPPLGEMSFWDYQSMDKNSPSATEDPEEVKNFLYARVYCRDVEVVLTFV